MKYYKTKNNEIYALEDNDSAKEWIKEKVTEITKDEADSITNPPPTKEQLIIKAAYDKQTLIAEAMQKIQLWQTQIMLGIITEEDKTKLKEWMLYVQKVQATDVSAAPDIHWPVKPFS